MFLDRVHAGKEGTLNIAKIQKVGTGQIKRTYEQQRSTLRCLQLNLFRYMHLLLSRSVKGRVAYTREIDGKHGL